MLILILIDAQYLQNFVFDLKMFEWSKSLLRFSPPNKNPPPPAKILIPSYWGDFPPYPLMLFRKPCVFNIFAPI